MSWFYNPLKNKIKQDLCQEHFEVGKIQISHMNGFQSRYKSSADSIQGE